MTLLYILAHRDSCLGSDGDEELFSSLSDGLSAIMLVNEETFIKLKTSVFCLCSVSAWILYLRALELSRNGSTSAACASLYLIV